MKCDCKNYNECINCIEYDECDEKPTNHNLFWFVFIWIIFLITAIALITI